MLVPTSEPSESVPNPPLLSDDTGSTPRSVKVAPLLRDNEYPARLLPPLGSESPKPTTILVPHRAAETAPVWLLGASIASDTLKIPLVCAKALPTNSRPLDTNIAAHLRTLPFIVLLCVAEDKRVEPQKLSD